MDRLVINYLNRSHLLILEHICNTVSPIPKLHLELVDIGDIRIIKNGKCIAEGWQRVLQYITPPSNTHADQHQQPTNIVDYIAHEQKLDDDELGINDVQERIERYLKNKKHKTITDGKRIKNK